jgi:cytochrome c biogenesis protein CcmG, thiol:disulfide interchange protein DsbE
VEVSYPAPELSLTDLEGKPVSLQDLQGTVVLVNNWATWCPPCKAEMPTLQAYFEEHRKKGFTIVAIDAGDPVAEIVEFVQEYGLTFPVWPDASMKSIAAFRNPGLPSSYVIDRGGTVRLAWAGAVSREMLEKYVTPLLKEN